MVKNKAGNGNGSKKLAFKEIAKLYDQQWVLLGDLETDKYDRVKRAVVLAHSTSRTKLHFADLRLRPKRAAVQWIGERPRIVAVVTCRTAMTTSTSPRQAPRCQPEG